jgi:hypothetical protein
MRIRLRSRNGAASASILADVSSGRKQKLPQPTSVPVFNVPDFRYEAVTDAFATCAISGSDPAKGAQGLI